MNTGNRVILIVCDSLGIGAMPDACKYGDEGASTLNHIAQNASSLYLPNLCGIGLSSIEGVNIQSSKVIPSGAFGRAAELSAGKDTITGHWEIAGLITEKPFRTFTDTGFPEEFINEFQKKIGVEILGNYSASGTEIIKKLGKEHKKTGRPIVYTSEDSVFQIAANTDVISLERLYRMCETAREMLIGDMLVGRVIARPFVEKNGVYVRTSDRRDYAIEPSGITVLDEISKAGKEVCAVGKISDIFAGRGITSHVHTSDNDDGIDKTLEYMKKCGSGLIFTNLVDFDAKYGHRRDSEGYAHALEAFDARLPEIIEAMRPDDILIMCADHGNDPVHRGWNHTREYIPVLVYGRHVMPNNDIGTLSSFADIGATICDYLDINSDIPGNSFLSYVQG